MANLTYGDTRIAALRLLDEVTSAGAIDTTADNTVKIFTHTNEALTDLAQTTSKIHGEKYIVNASVRNALSYDNSSIKTFEPGGADISTTLVNAKACFFEAIGPGTAVIEEAPAGSTTYTALETITIPGTVTQFTEYRRLITPSASTNTVRLRFTGSYVFYVRNFILYPYTWATAADIQQHRPTFEYDLPSDFLALNNVMVKKDVRQFIPYQNHILLPNNKIGFDRYNAPAEFIVNYWRMPTLFAYSGIEVTDDAQKYGIDTSGTTPTYRISDDAALIIPYYVAGNIAISGGDNTGIVKGTEWINFYETKKSNLITNTGGYQGTIINVTGW